MTPKLWPMIEDKGDIFSYKVESTKVLRCVTTNGILDKNKNLVMGAGIALTAKLLYPDLPKILGQLVVKNGNHVNLIEEYGVASFPTKNHFKDKSDIKLIRQSCEELLKYESEWDHIILPRPGCGMGKLNWFEVKLVISKYFKSDKFIILSPAIDSS